MPDNFAAVPISVYNNDDIHDDVSFDGCPYISKTESRRIANPLVWDSYAWMREQTKRPLEELFDLTDDYVDSLDFHHFEKLTDDAVAIDFEGKPVHETYFSDEQWELTHEFQKVYLTERDNHDSSTLEVSRILRKPMRVMQEKVDALTGDGVETETSNLKYVIYSAHDD